MRAINKQKVKIQKGIDRESWPKRQKPVNDQYYDKQIENMQIGDSFQVKGAYMGLVGPIECAFYRKGWKCSRRKRATKEKYINIYRFWRVA